MWWVGGIALSMVISLVAGFSYKSSDDAAVKAEMITVLHDFPDYSQNAAYYEGLVAACHHQAFEAAYHMGGRRRNTALDSKKYLVQISSLMAARASADGHSDVAATLNKFQGMVSSR